VPIRIYLKSREFDAESRKRLLRIVGELLHPIIVWWAVRIPSGPPRILSNREISRRRPRSPQLAGFCGCVSVSADTVSGLKAILGVLSLGGGIPFPRCRSICPLAG
jgi:hypothetical protein